MAYINDERENERTICDNRYASVSRKGKEYIALNMSRN